MNNKEIFCYTPASKYDDAVSVMFSFPANYTFGMSSLGYLNLFKTLDENPKALPKRVFADMQKLSSDIRDAKLFGFSFSFEFDFINILKILDKYKIPRRFNNRAESAPLVFAGGPVITANPEPYADFFDFLIIGDGDVVLNQIIDIVYNNQEKTKSCILKLLADIKGVYVSSFFDVEYFEKGSIKKIIPADKSKVKRAVHSLNECLFTPILTEAAFFKKNFIIEIARGCPQKCAFCLASYSNLPARFPSFASIKEAIDFGLEKSDKIALLGALIQAHPDFEKICDYIKDKRKEKEFEMSVSSLRADKLSKNAVEMLVGCNQKSSTIAIEAGSERLRKVINKNLLEQQIFESVKTARDYGLKSLKIYGMIGLPTETEEDIDELINLMKRLSKEIRGINLTLSISSFVPKGQTPFEVFGREDNKTLKQKNEKLKKELHKIGVGFKPTSIKWDYLQAVLSRGDRRLSYLLEKVLEYGHTIGSFNRAYKEIADINNIPQLDWYALRKIENDEIKPWDMIES